MGFSRLAVFVILIFVVVPVSVVGIEKLADIRYKIKGSDGNLWEHMLARGQIVRGEEYPNTITFTFDDGPDHRTTPILLDQLDRYGIKAAFFVNGWRFHNRTADGPENQSVLREIHRRGHFIGNHTFSHKDITALDDDGWRREIVQVEQQIRAITGRRPWVFRPPFGRTTPATLTKLANNDYTVVMWNLDSGDWRAKSAADLFERTKRLIQENPKGGVLLFHDTNRSTVDAFGRIVEWIQERNEKLRSQKKPILKIVGIEHYVDGRSTL